MLNLMQSLLVFLLSFFSFQVLAGPFGLEQGMTLEQIKKITILEKGDFNYIYLAKQLPKGSDEVFGYVFTITPKTGLCRIVTVSQGISVSPDGKELINEFNAYAKVLSKKYGDSSKKFDYLKVDSIWTGKKNWMYSMLERDRSLAYYWQSEKNKILPDSISLIGLEALAAGGVKFGILEMVYEFNNFKHCEIIIQTDKNENKNEKLKNF